MKKFLLLIGILSSLNASSQNMIIIDVYGNKNIINYEKIQPLSPGQSYYDQYGNKIIQPAPIFVPPNTTIYPASYIDGQQSSIVITPQNLNNDPSIIPFASGYLLGNIIGRKNNPQPTINNKILEEHYRVRQEQLKLLNQNKK